MIDGDGNEMMCKCGKAACGGAFGKEAFTVYCSSCNPNKIPEEHRLVYIPFSGTGVPQITDDWIVDLRGTQEIG
jgi:hypothetical protein